MAVWLATPIMPLWGIRLSMVIYRMLRMVIYRMLYRKTMP